MSESVPVVRVKSTHPESQGPFVEINESDFVEGTHELFREPEAAPPPPPAPPGPPPAPPHPLDNLPDDWRSKDVAELKKLAEAVGGRSVENKQQAIQVIEKAIKERAAK